MRTGPKFKIARRLGAPIFEKTQTQKYALSLARKEKAGKVPRKPKSNFGIQMQEKQKARFSYGISERQFSRYVKETLAKHDPKASQTLFARLESRLDNVVYRLGFAPTRSAARQMVSHGHICVNGRKLNIPSAMVKIGDAISLRPQSAPKNLFLTLDERLSTLTPPSWLSLDFAKKIGTVTGAPEFRRDEHVFDLDAVLEFYSR